MSLFAEHACAPHALTDEDIVYGAVRLINVYLDQSQPNFIRGILDGSSTDGSSKKDRLQLMAEIGRGIYDGPSREDRMHLMREIRKLHNRTVSWCVKAPMVQKAARRKPVSIDRSS
jgi:hypothetical protein